jgi:hypothetical protein
MKARGAVLDLNAPLNTTEREVLLLIRTVNHRHSKVPHAVALKSLVAAHG